MRATNTIKYGISKMKHSLRYGEFLKLSEALYFEVVVARNRFFNA